jgi:hypothetical protein
MGLFSISWHHVETKVSRAPKDNVAALRLDIYVYIYIYIYIYVCILAYMGIVCMCSYIFSNIVSVTILAQGCQRGNHHLGF